MPTNVTFDGTIYPIPLPNETGWGTALTNFFIDVAGNAVTINNAQTLTNKTIVLPSGSAPSPSLSFTADTTTGIYLAAAGDIGFSTGGVQRLTIDTSGNLAMPTGSLSLTLGGIQVTAGNLVVTAGNLTVGGTSAFTGAITATGSYTSAAGNITLTGGSLTVTAGTATIGSNTSVGGTLAVTSTSTFGNNVSLTGTSTLSMASGNLTMASGNLTLTSGNATIGGSLTVTGALNLSSLTLTTPLAIASGGTAAITASAARTNLGLGNLAVLNLGSGTANDGSSNIIVYTSPVRQTVINGSTSATTGTANFISAGTGLACNLAATATPITIGYAAGYGINGNLDFIGRITADVTGYWSSLPANNLTYLSIDRNAGTGALTATQTLAPVQYGFAYDRTKAAVLQFSGAAGSTVFLDDAGNTWTAQGSAKVQTNQFKFGTGALGGAGTSNALNGSTDFVKTTSITSLAGGGWYMRGWVQPTVLPGSGLQSFCFAATNAAGWGVEFGISNTAGTIRWAINVSNNGTSNNVGNLVVGTSLPVINQWFFAEATYDPVSGQYKIYINGVQENAIASTLLVCGITTISVGASTVNGKFWTGYVDKFEFGTYCAHPAGTTYSVPVAAPSITAAGYASDWFSIPAMQMNSISAPSGTAGTNPTFTTSQRVYVGEAVTGAATVSSVVNYALQGNYVAQWIFPLPAAATFNTFTDNIGTDQKNPKLEVQNVTLDGGTVNDAPVGTILTELSGFDNTADARIVCIGMLRNRNAVSFRTANLNSFMTYGNNGVGAGLNTAAWQYRLVVKRAF